MKIGIVFKDGNEKARRLVEEIKEYLKTKNISVGFEEDLKGSDFIICVGGDGTLIHKACEFAPVNVPFIGINTGNLGFLTASEGDIWREAVDKLIGGDIEISKRLILEAEIGGRKELFKAVNEVAVKSQFRVVDLGVKINGGDLLRIYGDGVIVSTQSGSTAYSLSAGGPIVDPNLNCILVTPINPIGLPIPSLVFAPESVVEIEVVSGEDVFLVVDGQETVKVKDGESIRIKNGGEVKLGYFDREHFIKSLNAKFGLSKRRVGV